ncbi:helicase-associated domain-containing protein [Paenibacillus abyssi]|uniref:Helicase XPB/Ssl2 N-terminal domain-containing protein n=1 Tax=Paenibacillus abyssi TaxID=1340531 RepID=A0A917D6T3_9BACL|nr:helicase-associated domain-containing protein [Paenibacillus abyssi]GGG13066.1 hypothetical protein GCM10010916_32480 [Paenibacillus abyssi]
MNVHELAARLSYDKVQQINMSAVWSAAERFHLSWPDAQLHAGAVATARSALPGYATGALELIIRRFGPQPFDEERLLRAAAQGALAGAEIRQGLQELRRCGIVFTISKTWGDELHFIPRDAFYFWLMEYFAPRFRPVMESELLPHTRSGTERLPLSYQMLGALCSLNRHGLHWTAKGFLPKKTIAKMMNRLTMSAKQVEDWGLSFAYRNDYPASLSVVLDLALTIGLLKEGENAYEWNNPIREAWLNLTYDRRESLLIETVTNRYAVSDPVTAYPAAGIRSLHAGQWYRWRDLYQWMTDCKLGNEGPHLVNRVKVLLNAYTEFGWMEQGQAADGEQLFRWLVEPIIGEQETGSGITCEELRIQPSGEIIVSREVSFQTVWKLAELAELVAEDRLAVYQLRPASIAAAIEKGWTLESMIGFLESAGAAPIPVTVTAALAEWSERAGKLQFMEVTLLRCASQECGDRIASEPTVAPLLLQRIGSSDFIVEAGQVKELRKRLEQLGLFPLKQTAHDQSSQAAASQLQSASSKNGLFYDPVSLEHYKTLVEPRKEELYPGLHRIPSSWFRQMRAYHPSTKKEIIEQALSWHAPIELRKGRETVTFLPSRLEENHEGWAVSGRIRSQACSEVMEMKLIPDMWQEMRLLLPGQPAE